MERKLLNSGYDHVIGIDEVGMGCLAGPVVVCAVKFTRAFYNKNHLELRGLKESKLLSTGQRKVFAKRLLKDEDLICAISFCFPKKIDTINIYRASREAMRTAVKRVTNSHLSVTNNLLNNQLPKLKTENSKLRTIILVDGNKKIKNLKFDQRAIVKGDQKIFAIACASIIAKVYRDKMMKRYAKRFPAYGFEQHKGYSTKVHQNALNQYGPCLIHRRSFRLSY
ncbi:MAG: ribonuclease HII [Bacteroidia bacterium]|nr:ribonuclease HII [Bacteroidia bacterium]